MTPDCEPAIRQGDRFSSCACAEAPVKLTVTRLGLFCTQAGAPREMLRPRLGEMANSVCAHAAQSRALSDAISLQRSGRMPPVR